MSGTSGAKTIEPHNPRWSAIFRAESETLAAVLGSDVAVHHIGSTAVPGIFAKPIVDILLVAARVDDLESASEAMAALGYDVRGEYGIEGRRYFTRLDRSGTVRGFHVHGFSQGHPHIARDLRFRDYLIERPDVAEAYSRLKQDIAGPGGIVPPDYQALKAGFIADAMAAALRADPGP